ncbi:hypothetical protein K440DRAFT_661520 [Wilcoxina mikolae CBS 423.85]|nr:hypothetical protein K440DRAFT_661520 [Wilcoxina mikolae CBS 423.85]
MSKFGEVFDSASKATNTSSYNTAATTPAATPPAATSSAATPPPFGPYIEIVQDGDVILDVSTGDSSRQYRVYSQVLCATSAVFRNMLGRQSNFAEAVALRESHKSDDGEPVVVKLPDDDPAMMGFVLHALHGQYNKVPYRLTIGRMVICRVWLEMLKTKMKTHPTDWLLISWVFGPEDSFTEVSRDLMLGKISDSDDGLLFGKKKIPLADCIPPAVSAKLVEGRMRCVNSFRAHVESVEHKYLGEVWESKAVCSYDTHAKQCDAMQLGLLYRSLLVRGCTYTDSLIDIADTVKKIPVLKLDPPKEGDGFCRCGHDLRSFPHACEYINAHRDCSWVPKLRNAADDCVEMCKGLMFSEFPSRTWGN